MTSLVLLLALSQTGSLPEEQPEPPPEARVTPEPRAPEPPSVFTRSLLATGGGTLAGGVSLGIAMLLVGTNVNFDPNFATAALSALMITGVAFAIHEALGGRGEITLSFLLTAVVMAGAAGLSAAISGGDRLLAPVLTAAIGSLPAAAAAVFGLEATSPKAKTRVAIAFGPTGFHGTF
ncbi:MAG: hypothetical protein Q8L48_22005 [Archangium sp.]|nr:hypothetical protein [Archangium sp.]